MNAKSLEYRAAMSELIETAELEDDPLVTGSFLPHLKALSQLEDLQESHELTFARELTERRSNSARDARKTGIFRNEQTPLR